MLVSTAVQMPAEMVAGADDRPAAVPGTIWWVRPCAPGDDSTGDDPTGDDPADDGPVGTDVSATDPVPDIAVDAGTDTRSPPHASQNASPAATAAPQWVQVT